MNGRSVLYQISTSIVSLKPSGGDDRILIRHLQDQSILVLLADGATGVGFGALAAECFIEVMSSHVSNFRRAAVDIVHGFRSADQQIAGLAHQCDTTGVVLLVHGDHYVCASVGDSAVYMEGPNGVVELTQGQRRKPRIGSGIQTPIVSSGKLTGTLLLSSDGLNMPPSAVFDFLKGKQDEECSRDLAKLITDRSKQQGLFDDLTVVVVELPGKTHTV